MGFIEKMLPKIPFFRHRASTNNNVSEAKMIANGWDQYAREWKPEKFPVMSGSNVEYLGDEWTAEDVSDGGTTYGLSPEIIANFDKYLTDHLLNPYVPSASEGLEIGPGGGRLTRLLAPRTKLLHLADSSAAMLSHLKKRFGGVANLRYHHTNGVKLPELQPASLDYVIAFDVFVHFEPRLLFGYLQQIEKVLKPGGTGIIHYSNVMTPIGWQQFERDLEPNLESRTWFATLGVMCPQLMDRFVKSLKLEAISSDIGIIPRDAVAVFRKSMQSGI